MEQTNLDMLLWGIEHIARNHGFDCSLDYEEDGNVCIFGGCNIPTLSDVKMLCEDIGIDPNCVESCDCGIDVNFTWTWYKNVANKPYKKGMELWRRTE